MYIDLICSVISPILTILLALFFTFIFTVEGRTSFTSLIRTNLQYLSVIGIFSLYYYSSGVTGGSGVRIAFYMVTGAVLLVICLTTCQKIQLWFTCSSIIMFTFLSDTIVGILVPHAGILQVVAKFAVFSGIIVVTFRYCRLSFLKIVLHISEESKWYALFPTFLCMLLLLIREESMTVDFEAWLLLALLYFCTVCTYIFYFIVFNAIERQYRAEADKKVLTAGITSFERQTEFLEKSREQMRMFYHDFRHFYNLQSECLKHGDTQGALEALQSTFYQINSINSKDSFIKQYTDYTALNSLISYYEFKMGEEKIDLKVFLEITQVPTGLTEFAVMLSNALENAYHACQKQPKGEPRLVSLVSTERTGNLYLELSNTYSGQVSFDQEGFPTGVQENHGYGMKSIRSFVKSNGGQMKCFTDGDRFRLQLALVSHGSENI